MRARHKRILDRLRGQILARTGRSPLELALLLVSPASTSHLPSRGGRRSTRRVRPTLLTAAAVLVVASVTLVAAVGGGSTPSRSDSPSPAPTDVTSASARARGGPRSATADPETEVEPVGSADAALEQVADAVSPWRRIRVRGVLPPTWQELAEESQSPWTIHVRPVDRTRQGGRPPEVSFVVEAVEIDRELVLDRELVDVGEVLVRAEHARVLPVLWCIPRPLGSPRVVDLGFPTRPELAAIVEGSVTSTDGTPLVGATVLAGVRDPGGGKWELGDVTTTASGGDFRLRVPPDSQVLLLGDSPSDGVALERLNSSSPGTELRGDLVVPGAGDLRVILSGPEAFPWSEVKATLHGAHDRRTSSYFRGPSWGYWLEQDGAWRTNRDFEPGPDRSVRVPGGAEQDAQVIFQGVSFAHGVIPPVAVAASPHDVVVRAEVNAVRQRFVVHVAGAAPPDCSGEVQQDGVASSQFRVREDGTGEVWLLPDTTYTVRIRAPGCEPFESTLTTPERGTTDTPIEVVLERSPPPRTWRFDVAYDGPLEREIVGIGLLPAGSPLHSPTIRLVAEPSETGSGFVVHDVPRGQFTASLRLGSPWLAGRSKFQDVVLEFDTREADPPSRLVRFEPGGRLLVGARSPRGRWLRRRCEVVDAHGQSLGVRFVGGSVTQHGYGSTTLGEHGPTLADRALAPGHYELVVGHGEQVTRKSFEVRAGALHELIVEIEDD